MTDNIDIHSIIFIVSGVFIILGLGIMATIEGIEKELRRIADALEARK